MSSSLPSHNQPGESSSLLPSNIPTTESASRSQGQQTEQTGAMSEINTLLTGAAFGAALTASGVFQPSVIISQLNFTNFHMIQTFLTAAAGSAATVSIAQALQPNHPNLVPRAASSLGLFGPYDGNILGGILLGSGMMLSGACPGTVLAQLGVGVKSGVYAFAGASLAGVVWSGFLKPLLTQCPTPPKAGSASPSPKATVHEVLGVSKGTLLLGLEAMFVGIVIAAAKFTEVGPEAKIPPYYGGMLIAGAQLLSLVVRGCLVGMSTSYEEVGGWMLGGKLVPEKYRNMLFSAGVIVGSYLLSHGAPKFGEVTDVVVSPLSAAVGGFLMILGSRMAGGCTSGHGISGISLLSMSSFLTVGATFAAGGLMGLLIG
ncbi:hypothetical protein QC764_123500 [Podospora pseudoanserina]|uniref:Sulphur transport domain-containing protein n=1 Tax=Podospora pseudoanserina TaxID=2609844 RepID=A0ABR0IS51_9PEZI|nr:hypothetical protein QC764_123500 [Podospora pseudoanserina]